MGSLSFVLFSMWRNHSLLEGGAAHYREDVPGARVHPCQGQSKLPTPGPQKLPSFPGSEDPTISCSLMTSCPRTRFLSHTLSSGRGEGWL